MSRVKLNIPDGLLLEEAMRMFNKSFVEFDLEEVGNRTLVKAIKFEEGHRESIVNPDFDIAALKNVPVGELSSIEDEEPTITIGNQNLWYLVGENDYIYINDNSVQKSVNRYFKNLTYISEHSEPEFPEGVKKRLARAISRYNLPVYLTDSFGLKEDSLAHAAYLIDDNKMVVIPEYFTRMGVVRIGGKLIDEFSKTIVHETGHVIWHQFLTEEQRALWVGMAPKFFEDSPNAEEYRTGFTDTLSGKRVFGEQWTHKDDKFLSDYARMNVREDFAESFLFFVISPDYLLGFDKSRYDFINAIEITDKIDQMNKGTLVLPEGDKVPVEVSDLLAIDLQTSEMRRRLAKEFETVLSETLEQSDFGLEHVINLVPFGNYVRADETLPEDLSVGIYAKNTPAQEITSGNINLAIYDTQESLDSLVYEQRVKINDTKVITPEIPLSKEDMDLIDEVERLEVKEFKNGDVKLQKRYYKKEEISHWITTPNGRKIPIPKKGVGGRKTRRGKKKEDGGLVAPKKKKAKKKESSRGNIESKPVKSKFKMGKPIQTVYSIQRHFSEEAPDHIDLRIKMGKKAISWAVPKWPEAGERGLAIMQPSHSVQYMKFHGTVSSGYGAGRVDLEDFKGIDVTDWSDKKKAFNIYSGKNKGRYALIHIGKKNYLLVRKKMMRKPLPKEFNPAKSRLKFKEEMWKDPNFVVQPSMGGVRSLMYVSPKENRMFGRSFSKKDSKHHVEQTDAVPHIRDLDFDNDDLVLDGEFFKKDKSVTSAIIGSSPMRARKLQGEHGKLKYYVYDILRYNGNDLRKLPYKTRLKFLERAIGNKYKDVKVIPTFKKSKKRHYDELVKQGWGGVVLKDVRGKYGDRFITKRKSVKEDNFVIMGWTPGKGKYKGMFGSIIFGRYNDNGKLKRVGKVGSGFDEKTRAKLSKILSRLKKERAVIAIRHLGLSSKGTPMGSVFDRVRESKTWHDLYTKDFDDQSSG